jgi:hypothetical protein
MFSPPADKDTSNQAENQRETDSLLARYAAPTKGLTPDPAANTNTTTSASQSGSTTDSGNINDTNSGILSKITNGRVTVANETTLASTNINNVVQKPDDDNPGVTVSSNVETSGRPFVMYGMRA